MNFINSNLYGLVSKNEIEGTIIEPPKQTDFSTELILDVENQLSNVKTRLEKNNSLTIGDTVKLKGEFTIIESDTSYNQYLHSKKIFYEINNAKLIQIKKQSNFSSSILGIKVSIENSFKRKLNERSSNFLMGILIGTSNIDKEEKEAFQNIGISHIVSVSGSNVLFIYILINSIGLRILNKKLAIITSLIFIVLYVYIVGFYNIPAFRALIIITLYLVAKFLGRKINYSIFITLSCLILILANPFVINNVSFLLSLSATIGLIIFATRLMLLLKFIPNLLREVVIATIIANLSTLAISYSVFEEISLVTLFTNVLILPVIPILMVLGVIFYLVSFNNLLLTPLVLLIQGLTEYIFKVVDLFNGFNFRSTSNLTIIISIALVIISILLILDYHDYKKRILQK